MDVRHTPLSRHALVRRSLVAIAVLALTLSAVAWSAVAVSGAGVVLSKVASGLAAPVYVTSAHDGSGRLFVVEQGGRIRIVKSGTVLSTPFLDISGLVSKGSEQGLLGLAFHPNFKSNGLFYVDYTRANGDTVIARYKRSSRNGNVADRSSAYPMLTIPQPYPNHNGGMITFGPDGYLYIGMGDGGGTGDPGNRAQNRDSLLGKILRIDVNGGNSQHRYLIPPSNPYVGVAGRDEVWSIGLRNPWRFSFDHKTGDMWIGDVGQSAWEEIDRAKVNTSSTSRGRGLNYGWHILEGTHCYDPATGCNATGLMGPVTQYDHGQGCAVTGGYVYRGPDVPALRDRYVFADYCTGTIWTVPRTTGAGATPQLLVDTSFGISSFGEGGSYELLVVDRNKGAIYRIR
jgi:glucose/arabinose dehydrogenase